MASSNVLVCLDVGSEELVGITLSAFVALDIARDTSGTSFSCTMLEIVRSMRTSLILTVSFGSCCSNLAYSITYNLETSSTTFVASISIA